MPGTDFNLKLVLIETDEEDWGRIKGTALHFKRLMTKNITEVGKSGPYYSFNAGGKFQHLEGGTQILFLWTTMNKIKSDPSLQFVWWKMAFLSRHQTLITIREVNCSSIHLLGTVNWAVSAEGITVGATLGGLGSSKPFTPDSLKIFCFSLQRCLKTFKCKCLDACTSMRAQAVASYAFSPSSLKGNYLLLNFPILKLLSEIYFY